MPADQGSPRGGVGRRRRFRSVRAQRAGAARGPRAAGRGGAVMSARIVDFGTERARRFGGSTAVEQEIAEAHAEMRAAAERYGHLTSPAREWERWMGREIEAADWEIGRAHV